MDWICPNVTKIEVTPNAKLIMVVNYCGVAVASAEAQGVTDIFTQFGNNCESKNRAKQWLN